jgi:hypothetical protein
MSSPLAGCEKLVGTVILIPPRQDAILIGGQRKLLYFHENAQSEIRRFVQDDSRGTFFRSVLDSALLGFARRGVGLWLSHTVNVEIGDPG